MTLNHLVSTQLVDVACWCGITYAIPKALYDEAHRTADDPQRNAQGVYCPLGHSWVYNPSDEIKKLRDELTRTRSRLDQVEAARDANYALYEKAERKVRRIQKGTCPHCQRHFANVERHMKTKHGEKTP